MQRYVYVIVVFFCFVVSNCTKTSGPANGKSIQPNNKLDTLVFMTATINNHLFKTDSAFGYNVKPIGDKNNNIINLLINGNQTLADSAKFISITLSNFAGPGIYQINPPSVSATYYLNNHRHFATTGQITIVSNTNYALIGTFVFTADSINVTNGNFNVLMPY